jgi:hypothetical protein
VNTRRQRLRRIWGRTLVACTLYLGLALAVPRIVRGVRAWRQPEPPEAPVYVTPSGERRRAVVVMRAEREPAEDRRGDAAVLWWSGVLCAVTLGGAVAQTLRIRSEAAGERMQG